MLQIYIRFELLTTSVNSLGEYDLLSKISPSFIILESARAKVVRKNIAKKLNLKVLNILHIVCYW